MKKQYKWNGSGTEENPYLIASKDDLEDLAEEAKEYSFEDNFFKLNKEIILKEECVIGRENMKFQGSFDGNDCTINKIILSGEKENCALFGCIGENAKIFNLKISGTMQGTPHNNTLGMLVGSNYGTVENCECDSTVTIGLKDGDGYMYIGFIAGINRAGAQIKNCKVKGIFAFKNDISYKGEKNIYIGGVCGSNISESGIVECQVEAAFDHSFYEISEKVYRLGGIAALNYGEALIQGCTISGEIKSKDDKMACGIVDENMGIVKENAVEIGIDMNKGLRFKVLATVRVNNEGTVSGNSVKIYYINNNSKGDNARCQLK
jgi:hypothetical protein